MKKRGVWLTLIVFTLATLVVLSLLYGREIFADITTTGPYTIFQKPTFEYVYQDTKPENDEIINENDPLSAFAALGEIEPVTFSVRANQDLGKTDIKISDLVFGNNKITSDNIEVYNIKIWDQCNYQPRWLNKTDNDCQKEGSHIVESVPELLVKDNEQDLIADEGGWDGKKYSPPQVDQNFNVNIKKDTTYTFYIRVKTPREINAGKYIGKVSFSPQLSQGRDINFEYEVLPFSLPQDNKDRLVYFNQRTTGAGEFDIGREQYEKYIDTIKEAGINGIVIYQSNYNEIIWTIDLLARKGFNGTVVFTNYISSVLDSNKISALSSYAKSKGLDPYFYGIDEPDTKEEIIKHLKLTEQVHNQGGKVMTAIRYQCLDAIDDSNFYIYGQEGVPQPVQTTDLPNYALVTNMEKDGSPDQFDCISEVAQGHRSDLRYSFIKYTDSLWDKSVDKKRETEYFYSQISQQREPYNRITYGFYLWRTGLDGTAPYGVLAHYSTIAKDSAPTNNHGSKYYDDFDGPKREYNSLYPSTDGPVLTLEWEGFREGIDDSRYVTLLKQKIDDLKASDPDRAGQLENELNTILEQYKAYPYETNASGAINVWYKQISDKSNQDNRHRIANMIREVSSDLSSIQFSKGYNIYISQNKTTISGLIDKGIVPVQFNRDGNKNWQILSSNDTITFEPDIGYYLYNKKEDQSISLTSSAPAAQVSEIHNGWNLLANSSDASKKLSDFKYKLNGKEISLSELIKDKTGYATFYIIKDATARTVEEAFEKVKTDASRSDSATIQGKKMFWFYVY